MTNWSPVGATSANWNKNYTSIVYDRVGRTYDTLSIYYDSDVLPDFNAAWTNPTGGVTSYKFIQTNSVWDDDGQWDGAELEATSSDFPWDGYIIGLPKTNWSKQSTNTTVWG